MNATSHGRTGLTKRVGALTVLVAGLVAGSVAAPAVAHEDSVDLVVLGDSYSAGFGAGALIRSSVLPSGECLITESGYADALEERRDVVNVINAACGGATATFVPTQIQAAVVAGLGENTELVTITAGGNDVNFTDVITACSEGVKSCGTAVEAAVIVAENQVAQALAADYQLIHAVAPNATIAALGYPHLFSTKSDSDSPLSPEAAEVFNDGVDRLNDIIEETAENSTSTVYVDVTKRFRNHGIGSSHPWINYDLADPVPFNNYHPNEKGYEKGYAKVLKPVVRSLQH